MATIGTGNQILSCDHLFLTLEDNYFLSLGFRKRRGALKMLYKKILQLFFKKVFCGHFLNQLRF
jgi:hypothetical protein